MVKKIHIVLVCHTELDFEGSWSLYDTIQPRMEDLFKRVSDISGKPMRTTFCATLDFLSERLDEAFRLIEQGHEIGIHSHLPGAHRPRHRYDGAYAFRMNKHGVVNQDTISGSLRELALSLGLPNPVTRVSSMFSFHPTTVATLCQAGFRVDCSMIPGIKDARHVACGDFILCDNSQRQYAYPYRPDPKNPWSEGAGSLLEFPVSGNLGGGDIVGQIAHLRQRVEGKPGAIPHRGCWCHFGQQGKCDSNDRGISMHMPPEIDVFQSFWHHFEFADLGWTKGTFRDAEKFLLECASHDNVHFSTAAEAAADLEAST